MVYPVLSDKQINDLIIVGTKLWVDEYETPGMKEVIKNATSVCSILNWFWFENKASKIGITKLVHKPNLSNYNTWFSLGFIFQYTNSYLASIGEPSFRFLEYAVMCFNDGYGTKQWQYKPNLKNWHLCQTPEDPASRTLCQEIGQDIQRKALEDYNKPELTVDERVSLIPGLERFGVSGDQTIKGLEKKSHQE
jgi:hypothetical protein